MRDELAAAMAGHQADYVEIHIEESESTRMSYRGRDLEEIGRSRASGGNVRAVVKGGWGFVASDDITDLNSKVATAVEEARLAGAEESRLAPVEPVVDSVPPVIAKDPRSVPLADKEAAARRIQRHHLVDAQDPKLLHRLQRRTAQDDLRQQ